MVNVVYRDDRHAFSSTRDWAMTFLTGDITDIQRIVHNGQMWSILGLIETTHFYSSFAGVSEKRQIINLYVNNHIQCFLKYSVLVHPSALIIIDHKAPPLLAAPSNTPRPRQISLNWVALNQSPEHCATFAGLGKFQPKAEHLATQMRLGGSRVAVQVYSSSAPRNRFLCPPAGC